MGRNQNMCGKSNIKRKTSPKRTSQLFRLLYRETRFEIKTNRRIRNRTYGGGGGRGYLAPPTRFGAKEVREGQKCFLLSEIVRTPPS